MSFARGKVTGPDGKERDLGEFLVDFTCPCGGKVRVFDKGILHALPMCADFEARDPVEFVRWVREGREAT